MIVVFLCLMMPWICLQFVIVVFPGYTHYFAINLTRKRELFALLLLSFGCLVTVYVLWPFLTEPWVGLQCVIVVCSDHTHLLFQ